MPLKPWLLLFLGPAAFAQTAPAAAAGRDGAAVGMAGRTVAGMATAIPHSNYDVSPDGRTFVMVRNNPSTRIMVIQNLPALVAKLRGAEPAAP